MMSLTAPRSYTRLLIAAATFGTLHGAAYAQEGPGATTWSADTCAGAPADTPIQVLDFESPTHLFQHAGVTTQGGNRILAGVEVDAAVGGDSTYRRVRIIHEAEGEFPPPARTSTSPMTLPVPVLLPGSRWGLVWAEDAVGPDSGEWIPTDPGRLWFAERAADGWVEPKIILETEWQTSWETGRTLIHDPQQGTLLMVVKKEDMFDQYIAFGAAGLPLQPIPLPGGLIARAATFLPDDDGIVLVAHAIAARSFSNSGVLVMANLPDAAHTLTAVDTIWNTSESVSHLRVHRDGNGTLHVIWTSGADGYHIARASGQSEWRAFDVPQFSSGLLDWASGIDRCGRVTMIASAMSLQPGFEIARWNSAWSSVEALSGQFGVYLYDGVGEDGSWHVGWSGDSRAREATDHFTAWLTRP